MFLRVNVTFGNVKLLGWAVVHRSENERYAVVLKEKSSQTLSRIKFFFETFYKILNILYNYCTYVLILHTYMAIFESHSDSTVSKKFLLMTGP